MSTEITVTETRTRKIRREITKEEIRRAFDLAWRADITTESDGFDESEETPLVAVWTETTTETWRE